MLLRCKDGSAWAWAEDEGGETGILSGAPMPRMNSLLEHVTAVVGGSDTGFAIIGK